MSWTQPGVENLQADSIDVKTRTIKEHLGTMGHSERLTAFEYDGSGEFDGLSVDFQNVPAGDGRVYLVDLALDLDFVLDVSLGDFDRGLDVFSNSFDVNLELTFNLTSSTRTYFNSSSFQHVTSLAFGDELIDLTITYSDGYADLVGRHDLALDGDDDGHFALGTSHFAKVNTR